MSIDDEIGNRVAERRLFPMRPKAPGAAERRVMFVSEWLNRLLASDTVADVERIARLEAQLSHFVEGGIVDWNYMRPLKKPAHAVFEIRSRRPRPSIRVFGRFAQKDVFVALSAALRAPLAGEGSRPWRDEIVAAFASQLFLPTIRYRTPFTISSARMSMTATNSDEPLSQRSIFYCRERLRNRIFDCVIRALAERVASGATTRASIAKRLGKDPAQVTRWLSGPSNWTIDTISDLMLALDAELLMEHRLYRESGDAQLPPSASRYWRIIEPLTDQHSFVGARYWLDAD